MTHTQGLRVRHPAVEDALAASAVDDRTVATSAADLEEAWQMRAVDTAHSRAAVAAAAEAAEARTASAVADTRLEDREGYHGQSRGGCRDRLGRRRRRRVRVGQAWSVMRVGCRTPVLYSRNQSRTNRVLSDKGDGEGENLPS